MCAYFECRAGLEGPKAMIACDCIVVAQPECLWVFVLIGSALLNNRMFTLNSIHDCTHASSKISTTRAHSSVQ